MRLALILIAALAVATSARGDETDAAKPAELTVFQRRILPIFRSAKPSSCAECHLSGVDLKDYIRPSEEETFAALVQGGLIHRERPEESEILTFISRQPEQPSLVTEKVRGEELAAFREWIFGAVKDPRLLAAKARGEAIGPRVPAEVIRHARHDQVLRSFVENVWSEATRCEHCHSPEFNRGHIARHGQEFVDRISWIVPRDPAATLARIVESGLIDLDEPDKSPLLMKPTLQVEHRGGLKMVVGDRSYEQFRRFAVDYAGAAKGKYQTAAQLPPASAETAVLSKLFLRIDDLPEAYGRRVMRVEVYPWSEETQGWSAERAATAVWFVNLPGKFWVSPLHVTARRGSQRATELAAKQLPAGRYLAKLHVDKQAKLQPGEPAVLGEMDFIGQIEFSSQWPAGLANKTVIRFAPVRAAE